MMLTGKPRARTLTGIARAQVAAELKTKYERGASIRALAGEADRSYGYIRRLLLAAGVVFRPRGGVKRPGRPWEEA
ncbi:helix-turn-helix domain-containing protein [Streptomyces sp. NPDC026673]|uniref:helix-turn-helix domain-containing protein n=1 Tax=Streptomyces sp. NPDC026673 TaxID=3155724 RepID=UPI0033C57D89